MQMQRTQEPTQAQQALVIIRDLLGFTQGEMGALVGVSRQTYISRENGHSPITSDEINRVAAVGINPAFFFDTEKCAIRGDLTFPHVRKMANESIGKCS